LLRLVSSHTYNNIPLHDLIDNVALTTGIGCIGEGPDNIVQEVFYKALKTSGNGTTIATLFTGQRATI